MKRVPSVKGLTLDAIRRRKARRQEISEEEEGSYWMTLLMILHLCFLQCLRLTVHASHLCLNV